MTGPTVTGPGTMRFRLDPGRAFERYAEVHRYSRNDFNVTITQRYLPYEALSLAISAEVADAAEGLWRGVNHADRLIPRAHWREVYRLQKPLWTAKVHEREPDGIPVLEALAAACARERGNVHYLGRLSYELMCSVNPPIRGEFYSVNPLGEWSLHLPSTAYPLDGPPSRPAAEWGRHPTVLARYRLVGDVLSASSHRHAPIPKVEITGKIPLPLAASIPSEFSRPFLAAGEDTGTSRWQASRMQQISGAKKEIAMPEKAGISAGNGNAEPAAASWDQRAEVQLTAEAAQFAGAASLARAGFIIDLEEGTAGQDRQYTVHFPGSVGTVRMTGDALEPAPPFPVLTTSQGEVSSIETAEVLLIDSCARNRFLLSRGSPADQAAQEDRVSLAKVLGKICGLAPDELLRQLEPMVASQLSAYERARHPAGQKRASQLAAGDVPPEQAATGQQGPEEPAVTRSPAARRSRTRAKV